MKACYLSIDFEDFTHDFLRRLGVRKHLHAVDALWKAYEIIESFSRRHLKGRRLTFFTVGQLARDHPDLVERIARDGHEIACHYNYHDNICEQDRETFRYQLREAVDSLSAVSGQPVRGFRAPNFSIRGEADEWAYEELAQVMDYDSSLVVDLNEADPAQVREFCFGEHRLREFPVCRAPVVPGFEARIIGGTYLRLLPVRVILSKLEDVRRKGFIPLVYMHPYEFLHEGEHRVGLSDLGELDFGKRLYWWARQAQWHNLGNRSVLPKLKRIFADYEHPGPMKEAVPQQ